MDIVKNDLNFFKIYKNGPGKTGDKYFKKLFILVVCFVLVVGTAYGTLFVIENNMRSRINNINEELSQSEVTDLQNELNISINKNTLLSSYLKSLNLAKKNFDKSRIIDSELFVKITSSMPNDAKIKTISVSPQSVELSCTCADPLTPAAFMQALDAKDIFNNITYDGINSGENSLYSFSMSCMFGDN